MTPGKTTPPRTTRSDFPQYLGPNRNATLPSPTLDPDWAAHPPQEVWRQAVGAAWSGFAVVGELAVTMEQRGEEELVTARDLLTGTGRWEHAAPARYATAIAGEGPRTTPTIADGRVFALGAHGNLRALELATGRLLWTRDLKAEAGVETPTWGFAGSPLVLGARVVVSAGGGNGKSLLAFDVATGAPVWAGGSQPADYSSPTLLTLAGTPQVVMFNAKQITAHAPETGAVLWEYPWGINQPHVAPPVPVGPAEVVFSSGYGVGAERLRVAQDAATGAWRAERVWKSIRLKAKFAAFLHRDGFLYGLDDGILACVAAADGTQRWKGGRYGHGQLLGVGPELVLVTTEGGELVLLRPTPEGPGELARHRVFTGKLWNPPALAGDLLLVRTDQEAACLRLKTSLMP